MKRKIVECISLTVALCLLFSSVAFGATRDTIRNMTYEEWLEEQETLNDVSDTPESNLEPVKDNPETHIENKIKSNRSEETGALLLDSLLKEKGKYDLDVEICRDRSALDITNSILSSESTERTAPVASLTPVIVNEDSLVDGQISTETMIAFFFNDSDDDSDTIVGRYVDGSAVDYILGQIDGGFVIRITEPGSYQLFYQVEDSSGEFSRMVRFSFTVVEALKQEKYQAFEGSFSSAEDSNTYSFSIDFSNMDSAAVCLVRKGYIGTLIKVYDESGNQVLQKGTGSSYGTGHSYAKNWGYIDKPSEDATVCNYTVVATPNKYDDYASDYRIIIGDKNDTELMMSGIENTVLLSQYFQSMHNAQNSEYVPNVGEYWFKYRREATSVITILSNVPDIRFKILDVDTLHVMFDSATEPSTHRTSFLDSDPLSCAEKARLTTVEGMEYYLVVYCLNPKENLSLREGTMVTLVGHPRMRAGNTKIMPNVSVSANNKRFSSPAVFQIDSANLPNTAQVNFIELGGVQLSSIEQWRMIAPNKSDWKTTKGSHALALYMDYKDDANDNALLKGTWNASFITSLSTNSLTFTPTYTFFYNYEYGD